MIHAALAPHPPIIIPEVGGQRAYEAEKTIAGQQAMAQDLVRSQPEVLLFITPHGNVFSDCISYLSEDVLTGNLGSFGAPEVKFSYQNDLDFMQAVSILCQERNIPFLGIDHKLARQYQVNPFLDHGVMVPLYYLQQAGLQSCKLGVISVAYLSKKELLSFGKILQEVAQSQQKKTALIASGDMSHRLKDEGPYNYHPAGPEFDRSVLDAIQTGELVRIIDLPDSIVDQAGECGYRPLLMLLGALDGYKVRSRVYSYEGPFGVGYLCASFTPLEPGPSIMQKIEEDSKKNISEQRRNESPPVRWARSNVEQYILHGKKPDIPDDMNSFLDKQAGAFVTIKKYGRLRGCIGTFLPTQENLVQEIARNALAAALNDPRFTPVKPNELQDLEYSVDILSAPEPARIEDLDPQKYGVIVSYGNRRGLLLPDLEGVDTVEQQIKIALEKAGIPAQAPYTLERFEVQRYT